MKQTHLPLVSIEIRADIYLQLSQLEQAGFSAQQSFNLLQTTRDQIDKRIQRAQQHLTQGKSIAESGYRAGIFNTFDKDLLIAGESSGQLGAIYQQLAEYYTNKAKRFNSIKSKLYLPIVILILAIFIQPLPSLIANEITGFDYIAVTIGLIFKITLTIYIIYKLYGWLSYERLQYFGLGDLLHYLQLKAPIVSTWVITRHINSFMYSLGLMLSAGLPILDALPKAIDTIKNRKLRHQFQPAVLSVQKGNSLNKSLSHISALKNDIIQQLVVGENSGQLAETLLHFTKIESERIKLQEDLLAEWIPRIIYLFIVFAMAISIIGTNPFGLIFV